MLKIFSNSIQKNITTKQNKKVGVYPPELLLFCGEKEILFDAGFHMKFGSLISIVSRYYIRSVLIGFEYPIRTLRMYICSENGQHQLRQTVTVLGYRVASFCVKWMRLLFQYIGLLGCY